MSRGNTPGNGGLSVTAQQPSSSPEPAGQGTSTNARTTTRTRAQVQATTPLVFSCRTLLRPHVYTAAMDTSRKATLPGSASAFSAFMPVEADSTISGTGAKQASLAQRFRTSLLEVYKRVNPEFDYTPVRICRFLRAFQTSSLMCSVLLCSLFVQATNPRRVLTDPSECVSNNNRDNVNSNLVLYVNDVLESAKGTAKWRVLELLGEGTFGQVVKCENCNEPDCPPKVASKSPASTSSHDNKGNGGEMTFDFDSSRPTSPVFNVDGEGQEEEEAPEYHKYTAVKVIKNLPAYHQQALTEIKLLKTLNTYYDPEDKMHVLRLLDHFTYENHLCLVFEILGVNLYELVRHNQFRWVLYALV